MLQLIHINMLCLAAFEVQCLSENVALCSCLLQLNDRLSASCSVSLEHNQVQDSMLPAQSDQPASN